MSHAELAPSDLLAALLRQRVVVISAHLDDAVLSCGGLLSMLRAPVVVTVFAGRDADWSELRAWDAAAGFVAGEDVMAARTAEDEAALRELGASGVRLDFLDEQYREPEITPPIPALSRDILQAVRRAKAEAVFFPVGLAHPDHRLTARGTAALARAGDGIEWFVYQDLPYAYEADTELEAALATLDDLQPVPLELTLGADLDLKRAALDQYASQMRAFGAQRRAMALRPERFWAVTSSARPHGSGA